MSKHRNPLSAETATQQPEQSGERLAPFGGMYGCRSVARAMPCTHESGSVLTPDGNGAYCAHCGETLA